MRILQIAKKMPVPTIDGESLAILNVSKLLVSNNIKLTLLALSTQKHKGTLSNLPAYLKQKIQYGEQNINTGFNAVKFLKAFFNGSSYSLNRFYSKGFENMIVKYLNENKYDIVQLEGLYLMPYCNKIRENTKAKIVLRAHNIEHHVWNNLAANTDNPLKKTVYNLNAKSIKKVEENCFRNLDAIVTISKIDKNYFKTLKPDFPVTNLSFGVELEDYPLTSQASKTQSLAFIGSLDWLPNIEGIFWFLKEVWPSILKKFPNLKFHIAGRNMNTSIEQLNSKNVIIEGEVPCAKKFIRKHPVFIVPLISGSGMRIKIIEAMALNSAVVSTKLGAAGINYTNKKNIVIANEPNIFADAIINLLTNEATRVEIANNGRKLVEKQYNNQSLSKSLLEFYSNLYN